MAWVAPFKPRTNWRVRYNLYLLGKRQRRDKYADTRADAELLAKRIEELETATKRGIATRQQIEEWIDRGWLRASEASIAFTGYEESRRRAIGNNPQDTDFSKLLAAYEQYSFGVSKDEIYNKAHKTNMGRAEKVIAWLQTTVMSLGDLHKSDVIGFRDLLNTEGYAPWTVFHYLTVLRIVLDRAVDYEMISSNPARELKLRQPKKVEERRILDLDEIKWALDASTKYNRWISGGLPTAVRLGLYAGLRNQEMCWLSWDRIDFRRGIVTVAATMCVATQEQWLPKDHELRRVDVKQELISCLRDEKKRQKSEGILGQFIMPGGSTRRPDLRGHPLSPDAPQKAWLKLLAAEGKSKIKLSLYSFRHTYCTMLLRSGVDVRTVQQLMGHASIRTTQEYLHYIEPEQHPSDALPY